MGYSSRLPACFLIVDIHGIRSIDLDREIKHSSLQDAVVHNENPTYPQID
jgi:hypothetical protein